MFKQMKKFDILDAIYKIEAILEPLMQEQDKEVKAINKVASRAWGRVLALEVEYEQNKEAGEALDEAYDKYDEIREEENEKEDQLEIMERIKELIEDLKEEVGFLEK